MGVAIAMGLLTERLVIHPLRNSSKVTLLVGTAGVALAAIGLQFWLFNETLIMTHAQDQRALLRHSVGCAGHDAGADRRRACSAVVAVAARAVLPVARPGWRSRPPSRSRWPPS